LEEQKVEMEESKSVLQGQLGITVDYLAYPNGSNSQETQILARGAGFKMSFTIDNFLAEESPNIQAVGRYVHTKLMQSLYDKDKSLSGGPASIARYRWKTDAAVRYEEGKYQGVELKMVFGGKPVTSMSAKGREPVQKFVAENGGVAGINGGFFAMAAVASNDNQMVGPLKTPNMLEVVPDSSEVRWPKIHQRPLVIWSDTEFAILPYAPAQMRFQEQFNYFMKDYTDTFMAGVWLVHGGVPQPAEFQNIFGAKDIQDYRRRAFIGITKQGEFVAGAATQSVSSEKLGFAIAEAGVHEAVLLDSGFSTSLVYDGEIKASGHSNKDHASRPVPHAITIMGKLEGDVRKGSG
jgi:hypothetical protein